MSKYNWSKQEEHAPNLAQQPGKGLHHKYILGSHSQDYNKMSVCNVMLWDIGSGLFKAWNYQLFW